MKAMAEGGRSTTLTAARTSLQVACNDLDEAVLLLPEILEDNVMASPSLVALLIRVVNARGQVRRLELGGSMLDALEQGPTRASS